MHEGKGALKEVWWKKENGDGDDDVRVPPKVGDAKKEGDTAGEDGRRTTDGRRRRGVGRMFSFSCCVEKPKRTRWEKTMTRKKRRGRKYWQRSFPRRPPPPLPTSATTVPNRKKKMGSHLDPVTGTKVIFVW